MRPRQHHPSSGSESESQVRGGSCRIPRQKVVQRPDTDDAHFLLASVPTLPSALLLGVKITEYQVLLLGAQVIGALHGVI